MDIIILYIVLKLPDLWNVWMFSPANIKGGGKSFVVIHGTEDPIDMREN